MDATENPKRRANWRNVFLLVCLGSPILYWSTDIIPVPKGAPTIASPEGRAIVREYMHRKFPDLVAGKGVNPK